jgi:uncharacterized protein YegL
MAKKKVTTTVTTTVTEEIISSNEKTQIICILDRSGSMSENGIIYEAISGFNRFLAEQRKLKDTATLTVVLFDDQYDMLYDNVDIKTVKDITYDTWTPRGMTALYDAIGKTINKVKANHASLGSEAPSKVLVCIVTDGKNNASHEYTRDGVKGLIKECENINWNFVYLAANQNAFEVGTSFGVSAGNTMSFAASGQGASHMSATLNSVSTSYRGMSYVDQDFQKMSKKLVPEEDKKNEPPLDDKGTTNLGNSITTTGTNYTVTNTTSADNNLKK